MKKYMQVEVEVDGRSYYMEMPVENFCKDSNIDILTDMEMSDSDEFTDEDVDDFTNDEIGEFAVNHYNSIRNEMGIDTDANICYAGFRVLDADHEDLISGK